MNNILLSCKLLISKEKYNKDLCLLKIMLKNIYNWILVKASFVVIKEWPKSQTIR